MAERPETRRCPKQFVSLAYVGPTITERKWKKARHWFRSRHDGQGLLQRASYDLSLMTKSPNKEEMGTAAQGFHRYL